MIYRFLTSLLFFCFIAFAANAQTPENIYIEKLSKADPAQAARMACDNQFAGTIASITAISAQSNDIGHLDTTFLCFGDEVFIDHSNDYNLLDDPSPGTPPGIGYVFYDCAPTATGPNLAAIQNDPCTNTSSPILINGNLVYQINGIWLSTQNPNGDANFQNDGNILEGFGGNRPVLLWFAPITVDDFANNEYYQDPATNEIGPCVNANVDAAFPVVYLTAIVADNQIVNTGGNGCEGSFVVRGGFPEYESNSEYNINITKVGNASVTGFITSGPPNHGETVRFQVPEPGEYQISIEDGKSCGTAFTMNLTGCNGITIRAIDEVVRPGEQTCVDVVVTDFTDILSMQFTINWDETVLQFDTVLNFNSNLPGLNYAGSFGDFSQNGMLTFSWNNPDPNIGVTLPDGSVIFQLCFTAIGQAGQLSPVTFDGSLIIVEVKDSNGEDIGLDNSRIGTVFISDQTLVTQYRIDTACFNDDNGGFTLSVFGGTPAYEITYRSLVTGGPVVGPFAINTVGGSSSVNNLPRDTLEITITDNSNPQETRIDTIIIPQRPELNVNIDPVQPINCFGDSNGILLARVFVDQIEIMNPGSDFQYQWNTGATTRVISNLSSNLYSITLTDQYGCVATTNRLLDTPSEISITATTSPASCSGRNDGALSITSILGGMSVSGNYNISVQGPNGFEADFVDSQQTINNIQNGQYSIVITDDNSCSSDTIIYIGAQKELSVSLRILDNVSCAGGSDGEIFVEGITSPPPASTPYTFQWNSVPPVLPGNITNTATTSALTNLQARDYQVVMTDGDGCRFDTIFTITQPDSVAITLIDKIDESCSPGDDGSVTVAVTGGTAIGGYTYNWGIPGQNPNSNSAINLTAGQYILTVTDDNMCTDTLHYSIAMPTPPIIVNFENDTLLCANSADGSLTVAATPSSSPIANYNWSNGVSGTDATTISGLTPGVYSVTITADNTCEVVDTAEVIAPPPLLIDSILKNSPLCPFENNGSLIAFVRGGTQPYTYIWSNNPASPSQVNAAINLTAGTYSVTVTDANDCRLIQTDIVLEDPPAITANISITDTVSCFNSSCDGAATATAIYSDNTTGNFTFLWPSGESDMNTSSSTATMLCQGNFLVTVTDGACNITQAITVPSREPILVQINTVPVSCSGLSDGEATIDITGGEAPYNLAWSTGSDSTTITGLSADTFFVDITDANNCLFTSSVIITEPAPFVTDVDLANTFDVTCNGGQDGQIAIMTSGGNPGVVVYDWENNIAPRGSNVATDLSAGTYAVTITDGRGCQSVASHTLNEPPPIVFSLADIEPIQCFGFTTAVQPTNISGGNGGSYAYSLDDAPIQDVSFATNVFAGYHTITVFDSQNCPADTTFEITQPNPIIINIDPAIEVELGDSTTLFPTFPPGTPSINPDSVFWNPPAYLSCTDCLNPVVTPLQPQNYTLTVYDFNGCEGSTEVFIDVDKNRNVYLPNAFSPNGDGINDEFRVYTGAGVQLINYVRIFDRWGNLVYEQTDLQPNQSGIPTWDGYYSGNLMDPAVFVYLIEVTFQDNVTLLYRGDISLLR